ncbi:hypothetical protein [Coleofasciculus sp. F4-SAH-05]|uniref:hypothetical protein n=1 Tax=Coleofasciculus sp. F4-SAH-05 TaxID=3069525 RepID=UPI0032FC4D45
MTDFLLNQRGNPRHTAICSHNAPFTKWSFVIRHSSLVIGHWSLVICHWSFVIGHWSFVIGHLLGNREQGTGKRFELTSPSPSSSPSSPSSPASPAPPASPALPSPSLPNPLNWIQSEHGTQGEN